MTYNIFFIYYVFQVCCLVYFSMFAMLKYEIYVALRTLFERSYCLFKMKLQGQGQLSRVNASMNSYHFVFILCRHIHCSHDSSLLWATTREKVRMDVLSC